MADTVLVTEEKKKGSKGSAEPTVFGVYQLETGSYTLGEYRFRPLRPLEVPATTKGVACDETSPVKFFPDATTANAEAAKLKARFDLKRKPKPRNEEQ